MVRILRALGAAVTLAGLMALPAVASAAAVTVLDTYYGGLNSYNDAPPVSGDVIGSATFDIQSAVFQRIGAGGNTLRVTINTNYAGAPEAGASLGTGYGDLFITPGVNAWTPQGSGPYYDTDTYQPGDWAYAFEMPFNPGAGNTTGAGTLYDTLGGAIVQSNVGGVFTGPYFRNFQAVRFTDGGAIAPVATGAWTVGANKVVFDINDNHLLGDNFAFSWAMTCANDVIQGNVGLVPEPASWALMLLGFAAVGAAVRRRRVTASA
ncbi:PEPxxWA-CTERM sorting domain-containing protein [Phenylobacterium sp.]|uniref:PEPxxWA-CTERM sorting domain-containing protein n=1 Tax=Phenylobacterium sp. TaxID=1871053 RepID=UPI0025ECF90B|nr:PEPxxWA-CTERM sorting domain-containing protein [Phenylobacterium sp.]